MGVLSCPIDDCAVAENALVLDNIRHYREGKGPFIGSVEDQGITKIANRLKDCRFDPEMLSIVNETLVFKKSRCFVYWQVDFRTKYGIRHLRAPKVLILEQQHDLYPQRVDVGSVLYINDNFGQVRWTKLFAMDIVFNGFWCGERAGLYNVEVNCSLLKFTDSPKVLHNLAGSCQRVLIKDDIESIPHLNEAVIPQTINGKKIKRAKDVRAYFNNPKKYPAVDPTTLFDVDKYIKAVGLDKLKDLGNITLKDHAIEICFNKPTDSWMCTAINRV